MLPWNADGSVWEGADMWPLASESREYLAGLHRSVWDLSDAAIGDLPLDAPATRTSCARTQRPMSATVAPVIRTRSVGESPRSSPRRPPDT